ncbi:MAG: hypothetical protein AB1589_00270 [Cyanobacteriota bacterium]
MRLAQGYRALRDRCLIGEREAKMRCDRTRKCDRLKSGVRSPSLSL